MTYASTSAHAPSRAFRHVSERPDEVAQSAAVLTRVIRRLAARHADQPDVVAVCEKWSERLATLEHETRTLEAEA